jgi:methylated-DNA-[protein]-cysteine S-methyltransferase
MCFALRPLIHSGERPKRTRTVQHLHITTSQLSGCTALRSCAMVALMLHCDIDTQFGTLTLSEDNGMIVRLDWGVSGAGDRSAVLDAARTQLAEYDTGTRTAFDLPLRVNGSRVQQDVCAAMSAIPFGDTCTYGDIAKQLGIPAQVVGQACGGNPIPIIIPCHRVMGAKGLTGFSGAGGVETKVALLRHEGAGGFLI